MNFRGKSHRFVDPATYTPQYAHKAGAGGARSLFCEGVALTSVADAVGTPAYVYSRASIENAYKGLDRAFGSLPHTLCYAMKANSNLSVLRVLARLGSSFDIVSGGELDRLGRVGVPGNRIVFSGVGKTREEIREALRYPGKASQHSGILMFNVESAAELDVLLGEASRHVSAGGVRPGVAIRVNPDVRAGGHPHIATGAYEHKFGVAWAAARELYLIHRNSAWIAWRGITAHLGSQIASVAPYRRALQRLASYVRDLRQNGVRLDYIDIGGGLGIRYSAEDAPPPVGDYARTLIGALAGRRCKLLLEPGRSLVGNAGVLLTRVEYLKRNGTRGFAIVDAAMNDLIRPALYDAYHDIVPVSRSERAGERYDVVGPVCESADFVGRDRSLALAEGDLLAIMSAGAYGMSMSSNYNSRPRAAEVIVDGRDVHLARERESVEQLFALEKVVR